MAFFILITTFVAIAAILFVAGIKGQQNKNRQDASSYIVKRTKLEELRKELWQKIDEYNKNVEQWREYHQKYEHFGKPTCCVGYSDLEGFRPWEKPIVNLKLDESDPSIDTQLEWTMECLAAYPVRYHVPEIQQTATFYKDARIVLIGYFDFAPEQLRFIKSRTNKSTGIITVTITTTLLDMPTITIDYPIDERDTVDELKAAFAAFKTLD